MNGYVHIVCFEAPSPPDYGGAIDVYFKIKSLSKAGKKIILHYFNHKKNRSAQGLEKYCHKIFSYDRKTGLPGLSPTLPYIVSSRINNELINSLNEDDYPIIIEGIHGTGIIPYLINKNRKIVVRVFNNEEVYYSQLRLNESNFLKRIYFGLESTLLKKYQSTLNGDHSYVFLSQSDKDVFATSYSLKNLHFVPCMLPWQKIDSLAGQGNYCLYHGNLSVPENEKAVIWLMNSVFKTINVKFIVAGKNPSQLIINTAKQLNNTIIKNPTDKELDHLINNAQIHVLPSFNKTGVKLKLLHALFHGRFCITNGAGVEGSALEDFVFTAETEIEFQNKITELIYKSFTEDDISKRQRVVEIYNNEKNALKFIALL